MYEFLDRLISVAMPRIRDFRGVSPRAFDGRGNYNMGVKEQIIFPRSRYDQIDQLRAWTSRSRPPAKDNKSGRALLKHSSSRSASRPHPVARPTAPSERIELANQHGGTREAPREDCEAVRRQARRAEGSGPQPKSPPEVRPSSRRCRSCAATRAPRVVAGVARSPVAPRRLPQIRPGASRSARR